MTSADEGPPEHASLPPVAGMCESRFLMKGQPRRSLAAQGLCEGRPAGFVLGPVSGPEVTPALPSLGMTGLLFKLNSQHSFVLSELVCAECAVVVLKFTCSLSSFPEL